MKRCLPWFGLLIGLGCGTATNDAAKNEPPKAVPAPVPVAVTEPVNSDSSHAPAIQINEPMPASGDVTVLALSEFVAAYKADEELAKYRDQTIEVTVIVWEIAAGVGFTDNGDVDVAYINVDTGDTLPATLWLDREIRQPWAWIAPGQQVTLRREKSTGSSHSGWKIVHYTPNTAPILTATSFAQEFHNNRTLAGQKYHRQPIYLSGDVLQKTPGGFNKSAEITLKGAEGTNIILYCPQVALTESIMVGQQIHMLGWIDVISWLFPGANQKDVVFNRGMPITIPFPVKGVKYPNSIASRAREQMEQTLKRQPDFKLTATELAQRIADDSEKEFASKLLEISGTITSFYSDIDADSISLDGGPERRNLICRLVEIEPWRIYSPGQQVTLRGRFHQPSGDMEDVVVASIQPLSEPLRTFSASELVGLYAKDPAAFQEQWNEKSFEVVGRLKSVQATSFELEATKEVTLTCTFATAKSDHQTPDRVRFKEHAVGDTVRILARIDGRSSNSETLELKNAFDRTGPSEAKTAASK